MPLQDLTPQLRTRLNRMERAVGWFIVIATFLLVFGFSYYVYKTAQNRGWFAVKARYYTYANTGAGLAVGDKIKLNGFEVGEITRIELMPSSRYITNQNVFVEFVAIGNKCGYIWTDSKVRFIDAGFLGKRELEITKGINGYGTYLFNPVKEMTLEEIRQSPELHQLRLGEEIYDSADPTNLLFRPWIGLETNLDKIASIGKTKFWVINRGHTNENLSAFWSPPEHHYWPHTKKSNYELPADEPLALTDRIAAMIAQVQAALPGVLQLTNQIGATLSNVTTLTSNASQLTANLNVVAMEARITVTNLNVITEHIKDPNGSLGQWLIPTNINDKLDLTLGNTDNTVLNLNTNLQTLNLSLNNVANITSNLNNQVQANTNILTNISDIVVHTDQFIQGLKRFWLFRHLFAAHPAKTKTSTAPTPPHSTAVWPKDPTQSP